jgi:hypothetical protein
MAMTKAELQVKYDEAVQERDALLKAQAEFVEDVIAIAGYGAVKHDLCFELEASLAALGIDPPTQVVTVERVVTETYEFPGFQAHRSGLMEKDPEQRVSALREGETWGFGYDNDKNLEEFRVGTPVESVRVEVKEA